MTRQSSVFSGGGSLEAERPLLPDADVSLLPQFFPVPDRDRLLAELDETIVWQQQTIQMYGRRIPVPRLTAWYGDPGKSYSYSKISMEPEAWTPPLLEIKAAIETEAETVFNSVLVNLYRTGQDGVAWHSDDEPELGPEPAIASVSFGATRKFKLRHKTRKDLRHEFELTHGSLLVMRAPTQQHWDHQVPRTARPVEPRINLTFRAIT